MPVRTIRAPSASAAASAVSNRDVSSSSSRERHWALEHLRREVRLEVELPQLGREGLLGEPLEHGERAIGRPQRAIDEEHLLLRADAPHVHLEQALLRHHGLERPDVLEQGPHERPHAGVVDFFVDVLETHVGAARRPTPAEGYQEGRGRSAHPAHKYARPVPEKGVIAGRSRARPSSRATARADRARTKRRAATGPRREVVTRAARASENRRARTAARNTAWTTLALTRTPQRTTPAAASGWRGTTAACGSCSSTWPDARCARAWEIDDLVQEVYPARPRRAGRPPSRRVRTRGGAALALARPTGSSRRRRRGARHPRREARRERRALGPLRLEPSRSAREPSSGPAAPAPSRASSPPRPPISCARGSTRSRPSTAASSACGSSRGSTRGRRRAVWAARRRRFTRCTAAPWRPGTRGWAPPRELLRRSATNRPARPARRNHERGPPPPRRRRARRSARRPGRRVLRPGRRRPLARPAARS